MTIVLACANADTSLMISDRRISSGGVPIADDMSKAIALTCADARVLIGYSGLATAGSFIARDYLPTALLEAGEASSFRLEGLLTQLAHGLSARFRTITAPPIARRFTVMVSGFRYSGEGGAQFVAAMLSNCHDFSSDDADGRLLGTAKPDFQARYYTNDLASPFAFIQGIGQYETIRDQDFDAIRSLLERKASLAALGARASAAIRLAREPRHLRGTIGEHLMVAAVSANPATGFYSRYSPVSAQWTHYQVDQIVVTPEASVAVNRLEVTAVDPAATAPVAVPVVGKNRPCPCGSGWKYKMCHGNWGSSPGYFWWSRR